MGREAARKRFELIYAPLAALFLTRHVSTWTFRKPRSWRRRLGEAWSGAKRADFAGAIHSILMGAETTEASEVEFGGEFPLEEIRAVVSGKEAFADARLLDLMADANRSRFESPSEEGLTREELALIIHEG